MTKMIGDRRELIKREEIVFRALYKNIISPITENYDKNLSFYRIRKKEAFLMEFKKIKR